MPRPETFSEARDRERADPNYHICANLPSMLALPIVAVVGAALCWLAFTFLPPVTWLRRFDYRLTVALIAIICYPRLHALLRRWAGYRY
ncbi:MAG: hypothetical protein H6809_04510 [Phycisphaeraceae bacterium]|nr:hypothetical protein [Phycisphaeraceae bacterium]